MILFKTIDEFRKHVTVDANMHFELLAPFIKDGQDLYIKDLLGEDFFNIILEDYNAHTDAEGADTGMDADNLVLLPYIQKSLAYYAAFLALPHLGASLGSSGVQEQFGSNSRPAPRYKIRDLQLQYINQGDRFADKLLEFLEDEASGSKYAVWFSSEANTAIEGIIVYSTAIASRHVEIHDSRRLFLRMKKRIKDIEKNDVIDMLCTAQYGELVTQIKGGTLTDANKELIALLEPYIAKKALYLTVPTVRVSITDEGVTLHSSNDSVVQKTAASRDDIKDLLCSLKDGDYGYLVDYEKVTDFLRDNIATYPLVGDSECWNEKYPTDPTYRVDNDPCNKHFSV